MRPSFLLAFTFCACAPPPFDPSVADDGQPGIELTWPLPEAEVAGCTYVVANLRNFTLTDPSVNSTPTDGQGHFHLEYPTNQGGIGYGLCTAPYCLVDLLKPEQEAVVGTINFEAKLVGNDHAPVIDDTGEQVSFRMPVTHVAGPCEEGGLDSGGWDSDE